MSATAIPVDSRSETTKQNKSWASSTAVVTPAKSMKSTALNSKL